MDWKKIAKELLIVTLGVFIGMLMNSWNEQRKDRAEARQYLEGIQEEMKANIKILKEAIPYHQALLDGLRNDPLNVRLSLNAAQVNNLAWKLAENNVFKNNIDKAIYYQIARSYQHHDNLTDLQDEAEQRMSEMNIMAPFHELQLIDKEINEEIIEEFEIKIMQAWIPIFETWTHYEKEYLKVLQETSKAF